MTITPIGYVQNSVHQPMDENWGKIASRIVLHPEYKGALKGLEAFSHALVICYLHKARFEARKHLQRRPRGIASLPKVGIFAQRVKDRPNPISVTAVTVRDIGDEWLSVDGLDAIDTTPVLDIKPYVPQFDCVAEPKAPDWVYTVMKGYF